MNTKKSRLRGIIFPLILLLFILSISCDRPKSNDTDWMSNGKYGIFMHYQYRILLNYSVKTTPPYPQFSEMTAEQWNQFVDGFDVKGFADQMAESKMGWVLFGIDDWFYGWSCSPNKTFDKYTGYSPGEMCSNRDLIMELAEALNAKGVKLICYYGGLNGYNKNFKITEGLSDDTTRGFYNDKRPPSAESRMKRLEILKEYADRYQNKIAGWWFDVLELDTYKEGPDDWGKIYSIVKGPNPHAVIAFSYGGNEFGCISPGIDNYTAGDTWSKQDLVKLTPEKLPAENGILWHGKIYCGNVYHGQGDSNQFTDQELIDWIKTCNNQGGVCTLDWPFDPKTGLIKDFGMKQMMSIREAIK